MPVMIRANELQFIINHARSAYPEECCGFLLGMDSDVRRIERTVRVENSNRESRRTRYNIEPKDLVRADEEARSLNMDLIGIYHSHPDAPAQPSQIDLEHAWPWYTYLLLSVQNGEPRDVAVWSLSEDKSTFHPDDLRVV